MELKIVKESSHGDKTFDTTVAQKNLEKYNTEKRGLESALERTNFELGNALKVLEIIQRLSDCWSDHNQPQRYFFFTGAGLPALPNELLKLGINEVPFGYELIRLSEVKKVKCPGCTEMRELICYYVPMQTIRQPGELVICGNSVHIIKSHNADTPA